MYQKHEQAATSRGTSLCSNSNRFRSRSCKTKLECVASLFEGADATGSGPLIFPGLISPLLYITLNSSSIQHTPHYGIVVLTLTVSKVTVPRTLALCEVTAMPASTGPLILSVTLDPATGVQVVPSLEVYAV